MRERQLGQSIDQMRFLPLLVLLPALSACLPSSGPGISDIMTVPHNSPPAYDVIDLDAEIADRLSSSKFQTFTSTFGGGAADIRIGVGDTVVVTIYEAASGGLFSGEAGSLGSASKSVSLPPQPVARNGMVSVPYVGQVRAAGLTPVELQATIEAGLRDKAIEPQVIVTVTDGASTFVTVAGDVGTPGRVPLNLGGDRLLDLIAASGGTRAPAYDSFVRVTRGSTTVTMSVAEIVENPQQNIYLQPDDQIYVFTDPQIYTAFGATQENATFPFETDRLTLAQAVGRAGGLLDSRANARGVFVFRYERPEVYAAIMDNAEDAPIPEAAGIPVVYRLDLEEPTDYFASQRFLMRDNDVIYVSTSQATDVAKFLGVIGSGIGVARSGSGFVP
jgi:polysaccharide export outer membrane protein